jgi:hypothetical protein
MRIEEAESRLAAAQQARAAVKLPRGTAAKHAKDTAEYAAAAADVKAAYQTYLSAYELGMQSGWWPERVDIPKPDAVQAAVARASAVLEAPPAGWMSPSAVAGREPLVTQLTTITHEIAALLARWNALGPAIDAANASRNAELRSAMERGSAEAVAQRASEIEQVIARHTKFSDFFHLDKSVAPMTLRIEEIADLGVAEDNALRQRQLTANEKIWRAEETLAAVRRREAGLAAYMPAKDSDFPDLMLINNRTRVITSNIKFPKYLADIIRSASDESAPIKELRAIVYNNREEITRMPSEELLLWLRAHTTAADAWHDHLELVAAKLNSHPKTDGDAPRPYVTVFVGSPVTDEKAGRELAMLAYMYEVIIDRVFDTHKRAAD